jgi:signal transduction histidine kinase
MNGLTESRVATLRAGLAANPLAFDALLAIGLTALSLAIIAGGAQDLGSYDPLSLILLVLQTLPLIVRRRYPLAVLVVTVLATLAHAALAREELSSTLGFLVALFTAGERLDRRVSALATVACAVAFGSLIAVRAPLPAGLSGLVQTELAIVVAWLLGTWSRERRAHIETIEERARRLEQEREERAERAVAAERERIARELHDVVTHHVSVIVIQAGAALLALDRHPDDAREAVRAIDATGRQALGDMRRVLGVLGQPARGADGNQDGERLAPMPSLDRLGELLDQLRSSGVVVELSVAGERRLLDPALELSAYRIVQEALTNVLKHAPGARARVSVEYAPAELRVEVVDDGRGRGRLGAIGDEVHSGHGLIGMRERAALFGGTLEAGPAGRGFRVSARLPIAATAIRPASPSVAEAAK